MVPGPAGRESREFLHVDKGEFVFVVGSSGSGKSTLIKLLMKELDSTSPVTLIVSGEQSRGR